MTQAGILTSMDYRRKKKGLEPVGAAWDGEALRDMLMSPAMLGYLMHQGEPVNDTSSDPKRRGRPIKVAPEMWSYAKHVALVAKLAPKPRPKHGSTRAPRTDELMSGLTMCGQCGCKARIGSHNRRPDGSLDRGYCCRSRQKGVRGAEDCEPPFMRVEELDRLASEHFLALFGAIEEYEEVFDPGNDTSARLAEISAQRARLRSDRNRGHYDLPEDEAWYDAEFTRLTQELIELQARPQREAGRYWRPTGGTVADRWNAAESVAQRRVIMASFDFRAELFRVKRGVSRAVFYAAAPDVAQEARRESWHARQQLIEAEEDYRIRMQAELATQEGIEIEQAGRPAPGEVSAGYANAPDPAELADGLWFMPQAEQADEHALVA